MFLDSRSFSVFRALAEQFGERVSKDALLAAGWPGQFIHENSLAKAVSKLRRAISGSGLEIAASYGMGYTLRDAIKGHVAEDDSSALSQPIGTARPRLARAKWPIAGAFALMLAAAAGLSVSGGTSSPVGFRQTEPITHDAPDSVATILWVDDNPANNRLEVEAFKRRKIAVHLAESTDDALKLLTMNDYRLVVSDLGRGDDRLAGVRMTQIMRQQGIEVPVIIYTIRPDGRRQQEAQRQLVASAGATDLALTPHEVRSKVLGLIESGSPVPGATNVSGSSALP
ncbi:MAG TPA: response regulator [Sphingomicrobium sp.]|nr:response regulator [Sphingomicrobium sp.]